MNADPLLNLPTDVIEPTPEELNISNMLFNTKNNTPNLSFLSEIKNLLFIFILFFIISTKEFENLIFRFFPSTQKSAYINIALKGIIFVIIYWLLSNLSLSRN